MPEQKRENLGKKVFFLYPHSVIQKDLVQLIAHYEYEVYLVNDHMKLKKLLREIGEAIVFINIDERLSTDEWEEYIVGLRQDEATKTVQIGVLTYNEDKELAQRFLMDLGVQAGFVQLKLGLNESAKIILQTLIATEAKGRRKYVRAQIPEQAAVTFNIKVGETFHTGRISDISSGGMACYFDTEPTLPIDKQLDDIQLSMRGKIVKAKGKLAGSRMEGGRKIYIILFESFRNDQDKLNLATFINATLQEQMNKRLDAV